MSLPTLHSSLPGLNLNYQYLQTTVDAIWEDFLIPTLSFLQSEGFIWFLGILCVVQLIIICVGHKDLQRLWAEVIRLRKKLDAKNQTEGNTKTGLANSSKELAGILHEVKQPIAAITLLSGLAIDELKEKKNENNEPKLTERLKEISKQAYRCSGTIERMQSQNKEEQYSVESTDINQVINKALEETRYYKDYEEITVHKKLQEDLPPIEADSDSIRQVITNLIRNGIDAMEDSRQRVLTVVSHNSNGGIHVKVVDTGKGLEPNSQDSIYNSFYTTKGNKGVGLGLSISKSIVENHNGTISVATEAQKGTEFTVFLPL